MNENISRTDFARMARRAFTLIELLVVIAVISLLAGLIFPVTGAVNRAKTRAKAQGELAKVEAAILDYKMKLGHYPPDHPTDLRYNQLFYELLGTAYVPVGKSGQPAFRVLNGSTEIPVKAVPEVWPGVQGFVNANAGAGGDEVAKAKAFLGDVPPGQMLSLDVNTASAGTVQVAFLGTTLEGPYMLVDANGRKLNPWRFNSSNPTNNPNSFDLWVDVLVGGKTNRFSNWSKRPIIVNVP